MLLNQWFTCSDPVGNQTKRPVFIHWIVALYALCQLTSWHFDGKVKVAAPCRTACLWLSLSFRRANLKKKKKKKNLHLEYAHLDPGTRWDWEAVSRSHPTCPRLAVRHRADGEILAGSWSTSNHSSWSSRCTLLTITSSNVRMIHASFSLQFVQVGFPSTSHKSVNSIPVVGVVSLESSAKVDRVQQR